MDAGCGCMGMFIAIFVLLRLVIPWEDENDKPNP